MSFVNQRWSIATGILQGNSHYPSLTVIHLKVKCETLSNKRKFKETSLIKRYQSRRNDFIERFAFQNCKPMSEFGKIVL
ncbi:CLUMA_CG019237, isoform A [Clunio marinus]|uniref:CLUMA_CG019237, isoform A n=1 Tax=Clunio marinus TaxID=568069 RepID=A0A1J1J363_9DIPT|nr:CLUMA_CG019237, isoform A [Clunio marinus]